MSHVTSLSLSSLAETMTSFRSQARVKFFPAWLLSDKDGGGKTSYLSKIQGLFIVRIVVCGSF